MGVIIDAYITHPDLALTDTIEAVPDITLRVAPQSSTDPETGMFFFLVEDGDGDFSAFEQALEKDSTVSAWSIMATSETSRIYRLRHPSETKLISPAVARAGGLMLEARSEDRGWNVQLQLPDRAALSTVWEYCENENISFELNQLYRQDDWEIEGTTGLTTAQREALVTAYNMGYFNEPRETSQEDLATILDISSTAAGGRIRRGMATLIESSLIDKRNF